MRAEQWRSVTDKVITIEQVYAVTTIDAKTRERLALNSSVRHRDLNIAIFLTESY